MRKIILGIRYLYHKIFSGFYHFGWKVAIGKGVTFLNPQYISIGKYANIDSFSNLGVINKKYIYKFKNNKPSIIIEEKVGIGQGTLIYAIRSVHIKKYAMLGPYCLICDYDHDYKNIRLPISHQPFTNINPVVIEKGVWIGAHVTICSGVKIGKNSVVGGGSVVVKNIPPYSLAVGIPARVIKKYNLKSKTWEHITYQ